MPLTWESAGSEEIGDQNADAEVVPHGYWAVGPSLGSAWSCELRINNSEGDEIDGVHLGEFPTEQAAKAAAQSYEAGVK